MKKKSPKKSVSKAAKGKKKQATKAAPGKSIGDQMSKKNEAKLTKERMALAESIPKMLREIRPEIERQLKEMGGEIPLDFSAFGVVIGMIVVEQLETLNAEVRTIRQLMEAEIIAKFAGGDAETKEILRQFKARLR